MKDPAAIHDVSDTAIWVAYYRAKETDRPDAMFRDPLARRLIGDRGEIIAKRFGAMGRYTEWSLVTRTVLIDDFIREGIAGGVDAVLNLGAGLDTRPYRMDLPASLQWVEADYPHMIEYKARMLANEVPRCRLERVGVDLADDAARRGFLAGVLPESKKVLVLTEGVIPYLTEEQVAALAGDLHAQPRFAYWIGEYFGPAAYRYLRSNVRTGLMANAPFRFFPEDWLGFFARHGWMKQEMRHGADVGLRFGRKPPIPWFARAIVRMMGPKALEPMRTATGYLLMVPRR